MDLSLSTHTVLIKFSEIQDGCAHCEVVIQENRSFSTYFPPRHDNYNMDYCIYVITNTTLK